MTTYLPGPKLAKLLNVTPQRVGQLYRAGVFSGDAIRKKGKRILYHPVKSVAQYKDNTDPAYEGRAKSGPKRKTKAKTKTKDNGATVEEKLDTIEDAGLGEGSTFNDYRKMNEAYKAALKKLEYERQKDILLDAGQVQKEAFELARGVRDLILGVVGRTSSILAAETDEFKVRAILKKELTDALEALADG